MVAVLYANTELVAQSWLAEIFSPAMIGTTLPEDNTTWAASGFVQVTSVGGSSDPYVPMIHPVLYVDCWACKPGSNKPPWGKANNLAETIRAATYRAKPHRLTLPVSGFPQAQFYTAHVNGEPRRLADLASYARYNMTLDFFWAPMTFG